MFGAGRRNKFMKKQNTEPVNDLAEAYYAAIMEVQKAFGADQVVPPVGLRAFRGKK
jgi:hypothetical protein